MSSVNKVILIGHVGKKPELRQAGGSSVCELSIATSERVKEVEKTEWHTVVCWGKTAESAAKYLDKGRQVYVEGRIQTRSWDDKNTGEKRYKTEVVASQLTFLGGARERVSADTPF